MAETLNEFREEEGMVDFDQFLTFLKRYGSQFWGSTTFFSSNGKFLLSNLTVHITETHRYFSNEGRETREFEYKRSEEHEFIEVEDLFNNLVTGVSVFDTDPSESFISDLEYTFKMSTPKFIPVSKEYNKDVTEGWFPDCVEEVIKPTIKALKQSMDGATRNFNKITGSPEIVSEIYFSLGYGRSVHFTSEYSYEKGIIPYLNYHIYERVEEDEEIIEI